MKAILTPYDMELADGVYTMRVTVSVIADGQNFYHTLFPTSISFDASLLNPWKNRILAKLEDLAEQEEYDIDQVLFLPDFSIIGL